MTKKISSFAAVCGLALAAVLLSGCGTTSAPRDYKPTMARFYLESAQEAGTPITLPKSRVTVVVNMKPVFTEGDLVNVELIQVDLGKCLMFQLTPSASRDFYRLSGSHQGRRVVLMVDDAPLGARRIDGAIADGAIFIFVELADEALPVLVDNLKKSFAATQKEIAKKG
jgi:hypothetical protein